VGSFERRLAIVAAGALVLRCVFAVLANDHGVQGDAQVFHLVAQHLADGDGFRQAFRDLPTAEHPPLWEIVLSGADLAGVNGFLGHRLLGALIGTVTVVLIGLLGRRLAGPAVGLAAAAIAALYPMLWAADISLMSESLYGALLVAALLAASHRRPVILGVLLALAALTRGEALALLVLLVIPLFWRRRRALVLTFVAFAVVLAPWTVRNLATFDKPVLISNNSNGIWVGANCPETYAGELIGYWRFQCYTDERPGEDESEYFLRQRHEGLEYLKDNVDRLPPVLGARFLRLVDAWDTGQSEFINAAEGRPVKPTRYGIWMAWPLMLLAVAGAVVQRRRRGPLLVLLAPVAMVVAVALATYGTTRFRFAAEPSICILAAIAVVSVFRTRITQFQVKTSRRPGTLVSPGSHGQ
jgi:4-amino-4-deoxy-L-arabinose transferase-like glycosyltransferase